MAKGNINYAGPGARVGIQAGTVVIAGGVSVGKDGLEVGAVLAQSDKEEESRDEI